jgi:hypothetical protein
MALSLQQSHIITDCFGTQYRQVHVPGNGLCGFYSLAYCFTGSESNFEAIIHDVIDILCNFPTLFEQQTDYSLTYPNATVGEYEVFMRCAIERVRAGEALLSEHDKLCFCENAHLVAISLVYNIAIFVLTEQPAYGQKWIVYNEAGPNGFICLWNGYGHFNVLTGTHPDANGYMSPVVPQQVDSFDTLDRQRVLSAETIQHV